MIEVAAKSATNLDMFKNLDLIAIISLMAWGLGGTFIRLGARTHRLFFWCAVTAAWLFTVPPFFNALLGTRGLAMGGGPFRPGLANDIIFMIGWPPMIAVHLLMILALVGVWRTVRSLPRA